MTVSAKSIVWTAACASLWIAAPAFAATVDFRSSAFDAVNTPGDNGRSTFSSFSYTDPDGIVLTVTSGPSGTKLYRDNVDGFGVYEPVKMDLGAYNPAEIEGRETLTISFSRQVRISDAFLTDLYREGNDLNLEQGYFSLNNGPKIGFVADTSQTTGQLGSVVTNGTKALDVDAWAHSITFTAPGRTFAQWTSSKREMAGSEYSVAAISYSTQVPELDANGIGAAALLLFGGVMVLGGRRRDARAV